MATRIGRTCRTCSGAPLLTIGTRGGVKRNRPFSSTPRVVSLLPSATEIFAAIEEEQLRDGKKKAPGGGQSTDDAYSSPSYNGMLVGRSHECDFPTYLGELPVLTSQAIQDTSLSSKEIDTQVRSSLSEASGSSPLYSIDEALLESLKPTVILTQDLCSVCSVDLAVVERCVDKFAHPVRVVSLNPYSLDDVLASVLTVGEAISLQSEAFTVHKDLRERLAYWSQTGKELAAVAALRNEDETKRGAPLNVAFVEWMDPIFVGGHWTPELIELAGASHPLNRRGAKSVPIDPSTLLESDPDFLIVSPCGFGLKETSSDWSSLTDNDWWERLRCVREGKVAIVDGNQHFNRPGPRLLDALQFLVGLLHQRPELIPHDFPFEMVPALSGSNTQHLLYGSGGGNLAIKEEEAEEEEEEGKEGYGEERGVEREKEAPRWELVHAEACDKGLNTYEDPDTGYVVMTEILNRSRGYCCGNGCRHCPYAHWHVRDSRLRRNTVLRGPVRLGVELGVPFSWDNQMKKQAKLLLSVDDIVNSPRGSVTLLFVADSTGKVLVPDGILRGNGQVVGEENGFLHLCRTSENAASFRLKELESLSKSSSGSSRGSSEFLMIHSVMEYAKAGGVALIVVPVVGDALVDKDLIADVESVLEGAELVL